MLSWWKFHEITESLNRELRALTSNCLLFELQLDFFKSSKVMDKISSSQTKITGRFFRI